MENKINKRLLGAASFVTGSKVAADIGCDHAYLAIHLISNSLAEEVVASDINRGPIECADKNIRAAGLEDRIHTVLGNGLEKTVSYSPDTVIICGMGGDLIWKIVSDAPYTAIAAPKLIMQPMTKIPGLRKSLLFAGYNITDEALVYDDRIYSVIVARYDGVSREWSEAQLLLGKQNIENRSPLLNDYILKKQNELDVVIRGKRKSGIDTSNEEKLIAKLEEIRNDNRRTV